MTAETERPGAKGQTSGMLDLWTVYDANYEELSQPAAQVMEAMPELRDARLEFLSAERVALTRSLLHDAMASGEWQAYLTNMSIGGTFARLGLDPSEWNRAFTQSRTTCLWKLREAYGDDVDRLVAAADALADFTDRTMAAVNEEYLRARQEIINRQQDEINEFSTPVLRLRRGLLIVPLIGIIDSDRARRFTVSLLEAIQEDRARVVIIDLTGVPAVDTSVANHLALAAKASRLLGATAIISGISTVNAETLARLGVDLNEVGTVADLATAVVDADRQLSTMVLS